MKKKLLILGLIGTTLYGNDLELDLSPELEKGTSGISLSTNYKNINTNNKTIVDPIKDIYRIIDNNNELIFNTNPDLFNNDYFFNINYGYLKNNTIKIPNVSLIFGSSLNESSSIGLGFNYNDKKGNYYDTQVKGEGYQLDLFYKREGIDEYTTSIIYVGKLDEKEKNTDNKINNFYYGFHSRYEYLSETYNEFYKGFRIDLEGKQLNQKYKKIKTTKLKNDSISAGVKGVIKKELEISLNQRLGIEFLIGYDREFMDNRIYKNLMSDDFKDTLNAKINLNYNYKEIITTYTSFEYKKSLNTSNNENITSIGFKYNF